MHRASALQAPQRGGSDRSGEFCDTCSGTASRSRCSSACSCCSSSTCRPLPPWWCAERRSPAAAPSHNRTLGQLVPAARQGPSNFSPTSSVVTAAGTELPNGENHFGRSGVRVFECRHLSSFFGCGHEFLI